MTREPEQKSAKPRIEAIELLEEERIVPRGSARTTWYARHNDAWVPVGELPGARVEKLDAKAGSVWQRRTAIELPVGSQLMCVCSSPHVVKKTPLAHLEERPAARRRVARTLHRVIRGGSLERSESTLPKLR